MLSNSVEVTVDLSKTNQPHYPDTNQYFQFTYNHWLMEQRLVPCARSLYQWLLLKAPAGVAIRVNLLDFQAESGKFRKPYGMAQIRRAVSQLEKERLLSVKAEEISYAVRHPGPVVSLEEKRSLKIKGDQKRSDSNFKDQPETLKSKSRSKTGSSQQLPIPPDPDQILDPDPNLKKEKGGELLKNIAEDPDFLTWIEQGIDSLPNPPKGPYRARLRKKEAAKIENQEQFLRTRKRAKFSPAARQPVENCDPVALDASYFASIAKRREELQ